MAANKSLRNGDVMVTSQVVQGPSGGARGVCEHGGGVGFVVTS